MKNIIRKIKDWLICKLGGFTERDKLALEYASYKAHCSLLEPWRKTVQELCRRSDNSYYDWCCEHCGRTCDKRDGWCERFAPILAVESEATGRGSNADL